MRNQLFAILFSLLSCVAIAQEVYTVERVPNVQLQDAQQYTTDPQHLLTPAETESLNTICRNLRAEKGVEIAVVVLPRMDEMYGDIRNFGYQLFQHWGLGKKDQDNGLLLLLLTDPEQRAISIEVGYGLEGTLPDGLCKLIQTRTMIPLMKEGQYGTGLIAGADEIQKIISGDSNLPQLLAEEENSQWWQGVKDMLPGILFTVAVFFSVLFMSFGSSKKIIKSELNDPTVSPYVKYLTIENLTLPSGCFILLILFFPILPFVIYWHYYCKRMKKKVLAQIVCKECQHTGTTIAESSNKEYLPDDVIITCTFRCTNCNHQHKESKTFKQPRNRNRGYGSAIGIGGSMFGGSGGSSFGGSFGGGRSGGGGASTRF